MVCTLSFGEISNIHDRLHIRLASALLINLLYLIKFYDKPVIYLTCRTMPIINSSDISSHIHNLL